MKYSSNVQGHFLADYHRYNSKLVRVAKTVSHVSTLADPSSTQGASKIRCGIKILLAMFLLVGVLAKIARVAQWPWP